MRKLKRSGRTSVRRSRGQILVKLHVSAGTIFILVARWNCRLMARGRQYTEWKFNHLTKSCLTTQAILQFILMLVVFILFTVFLYFNGTVAALKNSQSQCGVNPNPSCKRLGFVCVLVFYYHFHFFETSRAFEKKQQFSLKYAMWRHPWDLN